MEVHTARFGILHVDEDEIIRFPKGILGFEGIERYIVVPHKEDSPFMFLQALDDENLAFVVTNPSYFWPDYRVEIAAEQLNALELDHHDEAVVLSIVTVPTDARDMTANLLAPLVINARKGWAKQIVQRESVYSTRHKIADALQQLEGIEQEGRRKLSGNRPKLVQVG